jgi:positive regulator of sigma E activity
MVTNMKKGILFFLWLCGLMLVSTLVAQALSAPNDIFIIIGIIGGIAFFYISVKTRCFTKNPFLQIKNKIK